MLKTSLRGQVRQTVLNKYKPLLPLFEAVINAFQAIQDDATVQGKLVIEIERERGLGLDDTPPIIGFNITDARRKAGCKSRRPRTDVAAVG
jgi:hypothetical protein